tara:strand:- start:62 stop:256 length:195 start_codon:yes stop_codon:yes gene_type:complete
MNLGGQDGIGVDMNQFATGRQPFSDQGCQRMANGGVSQPHGTFPNQFQISFVWQRVEQSKNVLL